jgi:hypothetical protein
MDSLLTPLLFRRYGREAVERLTLSQASMIGRPAEVY